MRIQYHWTREDAVEFYKTQYPSGWRIRYLFYLLIALCLLLTPLLLINTPDVQYVSWFAVIGGGMMLYWTYNSLPFRYAQRAAREHESGYEAEIDETGIKTFRKGARMEIEWSAFHSRMETATGFALFYESIFFPFPKRAFTPEQLTEFRELIARKIPQKK
jgi:hypothetical protein